MPASSACTCLLCHTPQVCDLQPHDRLLLCAGARKCQGQGCWGLQQVPLVRPCTALSPAQMQLLLLLLLWI